MKYKKCSRCGEEKPETEFRIKVKVRGLRISMCDSCDIAYRSERWAKMDKNHKDNQRKRYLETRRQRVQSGEVQEPETYTCSSCEVAKPPFDFSWKDESLLKRKARCKACDALYRAGVYKDTKDRFLESNKRVYKKLRALVDDCKKVPCADCGRSFPPCAMDFDHIDPSTKVTKVSSLVYTGSKQILLDEIAKCEVVCAVCHRLRHNKEGKKDD